MCILNVRPLDQTHCTIRGWHADLFKLPWVWSHLQVAMAGFTEVVTWILCSLEENFKMVNREDDGNTAVIIGNPRSADFEVTFLPMVFIQL